MNKKQWTAVVFVMLLIGFWLVISNGVGAVPSAPEHDIEDYMNPGDFDCLYIPAVYSAEWGMPYQPSDPEQNDVPFCARPAWTPTPEIEVTIDVAATPTDVPPTETPEPNKVTICHKPETEAEKTMEVPESAVPGHLGHGDYLGECDDD